MTSIVRHDNVRSLEKKKIAHAPNIGASQKMMSIVQQDNVTPLKKNTAYDSKLRPSHKGDEYSVHDNVRSVKK